MRLSEPQAAGEIHEQDMRNPEYRALAASETPEEAEEHRQILRRRPPSAEVGIEVVEVTRQRDRGSATA